MIYLNRDRKTRELKDTDGFKSKVPNQKWRIFELNEKIKPFRLSRTKFSDYLTCKRCFYLEQVKGLKNLDTIPKPKELDDIWFYMNVRINFSKLLRENRPIKIKQQYSFLNHVCNITAPDNAMLIYFFALMQKKHLGFINTAIKLRLKQRLERSDYWRERFNYFDLRLEHVNNEKFPNHIKEGGVPEGFQKDTSVFNFPSNIIN